jgi:DNA-binding XRE family transcriptional regulator
MHPRLTSYLRPLRRRWGLTQKELAFLIGAKTGAVVSRAEGERRLPTLATAVALASIFDAEVRALFPGLLSQIHKAVLYRATVLYEELQGNPSKATRVKLDFLETVLARLEKDRDEV